MDYDEAFGLQAALNYREQVTGQPQQADPEQLCKMDRIMMQVGGGARCSTASVVLVVLVVVGRRRCAGS